MHINTHNVKSHASVHVYYIFNFINTTFTVYHMPNRIGKVNNLEKFDPEFFNISTFEANLMDSMARTLLEHTFEAIIDAGVNPKELQGTKTGVFVGCCVLESISDFFYHKPGVCYFNDLNSKINIKNYCIVIILVKIIHKNVMFCM